LLRTQFSSALEPRNLFLLVADIYRRISLLPTKIQTYITNDNRPLKIDKKTLTGQDSTTANTGNLCTTSSNTQRFIKSVVK
jgi:hypothetical protein